MARDSVTITAKIGPGGSVTAKEFTDVRSIVFDREREVITIVHSDPNKHTEFQYSDIATISATVTGGETAFTIST